MRDFVLITLALVASIAWCAEVRAQDDDSAAPAAEEADYELMDPDAEADPADAAEALTGVIDGVAAVKAAKGDKTAMFLAISGLIAAILKLLLWAARTWFRKLFEKGFVLRIICVVVGFAVYLLSDFAAGVEWYNALILALGGPGAILITELQKIGRDIAASKE